jgi:cell division topological specificity factor
MAALLDFIGRLFGRVDQGSSSIAKKRLQLVLVQDRTNMSPEVLEDLKTELIGVLSRYLEIDEVGMSVELDRSDDSIALVASIPVKSVRARSVQTDSLKSARVGE